MKFLLPGITLTCAVICMPTAAAVDNPSDIVGLTISGPALDEPAAIAMTPVATADRKPSQLEIFYADPTVFADNGHYYLLGTRSYEPLGFTMLESDDLYHWDYCTTDSMTLRQGNSTYGTTGFWAPQIIREGNRYLMAYTANEQTALAASTSIAGPYTQQQPECIDGSAKNIDPFVFRDDDGRYYLYHVRFGGGNYLWVAEFNPSTGRIDSSTLTKCFANTQPWEHTGAYPSDPIMEGPTMVKIDNTYYLFYSANHYLSPDYAVGYATAPTPTGPWTKNPANPIINRSIVGEPGSGHGDVFTDPDGRMHYVYHVHHDATKANPRRTRIVDLVVDRSHGEPYSITCDPASVIVPTQSTGTGVFDCYARLRPGTLSLAGVTSKGRSVAIGGSFDTLDMSGTPVACDREGVYRIMVDLNAGSISLTRADSLQVLGTVAPDGAALPYAGDGVWSGEVVLDRSTDGGEYINRYIYFGFGGDSHVTYKRVPGSAYGLTRVSDGFQGENIRLNQGSYRLTADLRRGTYSIDGDVDSLRICVFGSSVANGQGAEGFKGYAYRFNNLLAERSASGTSPNAFHVAGVSIGGNTTQNLLERYDDLIHDYGKYVVLGLSMGNEGLHGSSSPRLVFNGFVSRMLKLIERARADGKVPVVMNNYTRGDYTASDYSYIRQVNLQIHEWDVASVNTLGAIDDGQGRWASGYMADDAHPNDAGHQEFMNAIVPSLFDALALGKPQPVRDTDSATFTLADRATLTITPEATCRAFTLHMRLSGSDAGRLISFNSGVRKKAAWVEVNPNGTITYNPPSGAAATTTTAPLADGEFHHLTLTHYYARGCTMLYIDNELAVTVTGQLLPDQFTIGDTNTDAARTLSEISFWRAGMNADEIAAINSGKMLKSSLEFYTTFADTLPTVTDGTVVPLPNRAQSLNAIIYTPTRGNNVAAIDGDPDARPMHFFRANGRQIAPANARNGVYIVTYSDGSVRKLHL